MEPETPAIEAEIIDIKPNSDLDPPEFYLESINFTGYLTIKFSHKMVIDETSLNIKQTSLKFELNPVTETAPARRNLQSS